MVQFTLDWLDYISLFFIIFMGIPHGALDGAISVTLGFTKSFYLQVRFIITYLSVATLIVVLWYFLPVFSQVWGMGYEVNDVTPAHAHEPAFISFTYYPYIEDPSKAQPLELCTFPDGSIEIDLSKCAEHVQDKTRQWGNPLLSHGEGSGPRFRYRRHWTCQFLLPVGLLRHCGYHCFWCVG